MLQVDSCVFFCDFAFLLALLDLGVYLMNVVCSNVHRTHHTEGAPHFHKRWGVLGISPKIAPLKGKEFAPI